MAAHAVEPSDEEDAGEDIDMKQFEIAEGGYATPMKTSTTPRKHAYRHLSRGTTQRRQPTTATIDSQAKVYFIATYQILHHMALIYCVICVSYLMFSQANSANCACDVTTAFGSDVTNSPTAFGSTLQPTSNPAVPQSEDASTRTPTTGPSTAASPDGFQPSAHSPSAAPTVRPTLQPTADHSAYQHFIGDYKISAQNSSHGNWLLCDGSFVDSREYPSLFAVIGYAFGSFAGYPRFFALPNSSDRVLGIAGDSNALGSVVGHESVNVTITNLPPHSHYIANSNYCGARYSASTAPYLGYQCTLGSGLLWNENFEYELRANSNAPDRFLSSNTGNGAPLSVMQPTVFVGDLFIYAAQ